MCGIVGYVGSREAAPVILDGLRRLEYRGYDSAGLVVLDGRGLQIRRALGKIANLEARLAADPVSGALGLGHTRWATHGRPSEANAHPHTDCTGTVAVVHNGIVENHAALKERLIAEGHRFTSETDTEVIAHLLEAYRSRGSDLVDAVRSALGELQGTYAVAVLAADVPDRLIAARHGAGAAVVGLGAGGAHLASDIPAILPHTRDVIVLGEDEIAVIRRDGVLITGLDGRPVVRPVTRVPWDAAMAQKGGYPHFMLKEIHEQPRAVADTFRGRLAETLNGALLREANLDARTVRRLRRVVLVACGTSYHAALVGRSMIERLTGLPAEVDLASEFRYRELVLGPDTLIVAVSQSGETADTLGAIKPTPRYPSPVVGITNVVGSALARETTGTLYTHAGPEIGVASTKTFTATVTVCYLLAVALGRALDALSAIDARKRLEELLEMPELMERALAAAPAVEEVAAGLQHYGNFLFLGRGVQYPVALEGALKLKELSYLHAEGYAAGEMKHGPIALIDAGLPVVALAPRDASYHRMLSNLEEVRAREGRVIAVAHEGDRDVERVAEAVLTVPGTAELLGPLVSVIPLQLLAYHVARLRGCDIDQPRNLAKSVTVE
ncbi:MAG TPA: glutamine--fructose-6-phosphate transaminase (isomerizing) [Candidatus Binatia bacterium]|nr:glutamine--fructose-6-phosphate transaminase (isomerizing) [Candidatus Binatia bacterium]